MSPAKMHLLVGEAGRDGLQRDVGEGHPHVVGLGPVEIAEQRAVAEDGPVLAGAQQPRAAGAAAAAPDGRRADHPVARLEPVDAAPDRLHHARRTRGR